VVDEPRPQDPAPAERVRDVVELRLPADPAYLAVLRTATAGLAASLDFTLDEIEDLRIAVDEACAILLPDVVAGERLDCVFTLEGDALEVTVSARIEGDHRPQKGSFGWTVLEALAGSVESGATGGRAYLRLRKRRAGAPR
jgi:serine/threonine-protein kinase RsbW